MIENRGLVMLSSADVKAHMTRIEKPKDSYVEVIANDLGGHMFGQPEACKALAKHVAKADTALADPHRPLASVFFLGASGTGKSELARSLALQQFGDTHSDRIKFIDCAEFQQEHTIHKLVGAPPSYIGFSSDVSIMPEWLADKGKRSVIVFDEIEKANPALHRLLLGIMEEARMTTNKGECDFSNSFIIMTSNVGSHEIERIKNGKDSIGFVRSKTQESIEKAGVNALKEHFAPEFVNRLDDIIVFNSLKPEHYSKIYDKFLAELNSDIHKRFEKPPFVATTHEFKDYMLSKIDPDFGGRGMRHAFDRELIQKLADVFIDIDVSNRPIIADFDEGEVVFYTDEIPTKEEPRPEPEKIIIPIDPEIETPESPCASIPLTIKVVDFKEPQIRRKRRRR